MKILVALVCSYLIFCISISAQEVVGNVIDNSTRLPIEYVIAHSGSKQTQTDEAGKFTIAGLSSGDTLRFEYLGYEDYVQIIQANNFDEKLAIHLKPKPFDIGEVTIINSVKSINTISTIDLEVNPVSSSQEVLRKVPGLLIGQHAGGGKAEQIFLRGFDIDHGTDITLNVDGIPVNMVSHAHGQGYSDLHFIIPETIDNIDFGKGPYYSDIGNFNTAGYVNFKTKDKIDNSSVKLELGSFDTGRVLGLFNLLESDKNKSAYIATELQQSEGPFESSQNFNRINLMGKYSIRSESDDLFSILVSRMQSRWDASGQIPQRLVDAGQITRFGAVDDTEGGNTNRTNIAANYTKNLGENKFVKTSVFYSNYNFELFSNFTFFLEDPINGDQIRQFENRDIFGINTTLFNTHSVKSDNDLELSYNLGFRYDDVDNIELSNTANRRTTLNTLSLGDVDETNFYLSANADFSINRWLFNAGVRLEYFNFNYTNRLSTVFDIQAIDKILALPKFNIIYNPNSRLQYYLKSGVGFHSNDSRVVIDGDADVELPLAYGTDFGLIYKPVKGLIINAALWYLFLEQEFVYVGDTGIVEPSGRTRRQGIDLSIRYQLGDHFYLNTDLTYTDPIAFDEEDGENFIPLAVDFMAAGGFTFKNLNGFSGGIRYRYITDRPANEDNSIQALGYFVLDANANYAFHHFNLGISVENLLDTEWNEAQFATESRLSTEKAPVEELHFTPGVPFFLKANLTYTF